MHHHLFSTDTNIMTVTPLISIIIPVYNAAPFLKKCIGSIINQTFQNWELICINDGSTDESGSLLDSYSKQDKRIRVIHKHNEGVSSARNHGLDYSSAPYLTMVDADDWLEPDALNKLIPYISEDDCDLVCCSMRKIFSDGHAETEKAPFPDGLHYAKPADIYQFSMRSPWCKIYKREIIEREHIRFPLGVPICEDDVFVVSYWFHVKRFYMLNTPLYNYLQSESSVLKKLGAGLLPYCDYQATLNVPLLIHNYVVSRVESKDKLATWKSLLLKSQFHILSWMCQCNKNNKTKKQLKEHAYKNIKIISQSLSWGCVTKIHFKVLMSRMVKKHLAIIRKVLFR